MQFENAFEVPLSPREAWRTLLDIRKIAPCMPGAELTEIVNDTTFKGKVSVRLGPVNLSFNGTVVFEEIDEQNLSVRASARGADEKGRGGADAKVRFSLEPESTGTRVVVVTDLNLSGSVAQYGRASGVIRGVANQITGEFAKNLKAKINASQAAPGVGPSLTAPGEAPDQSIVAAKPISAFGLFFKLMHSWLAGIFGSSKS